MRTNIVDYTDRLTSAVAAFNNRLHAGGDDMRFPEAAVSPRLPKLSGREIFEERYLAVDESQTVHGGYVLKHQTFWLNRQTVSLGDFGLPISEGIINRHFAPLGVLLLRDAQQRQPLLYSLGIGSYKEALSRLLAASGWRLSSVPFYFHVVHPVRFLRNIVYLRRSALGHCLMDLAAATGLGWVALKSFQSLRTRRGPAPDVRAEPVSEFAAWTDELWNANKNHYGMSAVRDQATLGILYPADNERFLRLRVTAGAKTIGWAVVLDTVWCGHKYFGSMRLGSIVDCFAAPGAAAAVIRSARDHLLARQVDLIVSNQSHAAWCEAMNTAGFFRGPSNFIFASSPKLTEMLDSAGLGPGDLHFNRGDGDGPINL